MDFRYPCELIDCPSGLGSKAGRCDSVPRKWIFEKWSHQIRLQCPGGWRPHPGPCQNLQGLPWDVFGRTACKISSWGGDYQHWGGTVGAWFMFPRRWASFVPQSEIELCALVPRLIYILIDSHRFPQKRNRCSFPTWALLCGMNKCNT